MSAAQLQGTLLHESIHVLLVRQSADAESVWKANKKSLSIQGNPYAVAKFTELVRKYLIAQEEVFAYENEASLYPPISPFKGDYDSFITNAKSFLEHRGLKLATISKSIRVHEAVGKKAVKWDLAFDVPAGAVDLGVGDEEVINLLLGTYPLH